MYNSSISFPGWQPWYAIESIISSDRNTEVDRSTIKSVDLRLSLSILYKVRSREKSRFLARSKV